MTRLPVYILNKIILTNYTENFYKFCRAVLWTAEEEGYIGAKSYLKDHQNELDNFIAAIESDGGTFKPTGLLFHGTKKAACIMQEIVQ